MESLDFFRKADKSAAAHITGHNTFGAFVSDLTAAALAEMGLQELPIVTTYQQPLQDSAGRFFFLPDFSVPGGPDVVR